MPGREPDDVVAHVRAVDVELLEQLGRGVAAEVLEEAVDEHADQVGHVLAGRSGDGEVVDGADDVGDLVAAQQPVETGDLLGGREVPGLQDGLAGGGVLHGLDDDPAEASYGEGAALAHGVAEQALQRLAGRPDHAGRGAGAERHQRAEPGHLVGDGLVGLTTSPTIRPMNRDATVPITGLSATWAMARSTSGLSWSSASTSASTRARSTSSPSG